MKIMKEPLDLLIDKVSEIRRDIINKIIDVVNIQEENAKTDEEKKAYNEVINLLEKMSEKLNLKEAQLIIRKSQLKS